MFVFVTATTKAIGMCCKEGRQLFLFSDLKCGMEEVQYPLPSQKWAYLVEYWEAVTSCTPPPPHAKFGKNHSGCNMWKQISLSVVLLIRDQC
jgi:hypothetical protein